LILYQDPISGNLQNGKTGNRHESREGEKIQTRIGGMDRIENKKKPNQTPILHILPILV
jgi:hypothetical protein